MSNSTFMTMSKFWHFFITDIDDLSIIHKGMHRVDMTMATHPDVHQIVYAMRHLSDCLALEGYICFAEAKDKAMVQALLPEYWIRMYDYYGEGISYVNYLNHNSIFVNYGVTT